jgi:F-type H+-transporting ATPase subunit delta
MPTDRTLLRKTSTVYAEVLLQATADENSAFEVSGQLEQILTFIRGNVELRNTLADRTLPGDARARVIEEVFAGFDPVLLKVLAVMIQRDDISVLARVNETYIDLVEEKLNAVIIDVTTVVALDDALRDSIQQKYSAQFGRRVLLREHIDPSLLGGIVLSARGRRIDASVASQLESARMALVRT